jgi:hypothetical protein
MKAMALSSFGKKMRKIQYSSSSSFLSQTSIKHQQNNNKIPNFRSNHSKR